MKTAKSIKAAFVKAAGVGILALTLILGAGLAGADAAPGSNLPAVTPLDGGGSCLASRFTRPSVPPEHRVVRHGRIGFIDLSR